MTQALAAQEVVAVVVHELPLLGGLARVLKTMGVQMKARALSLWAAALRTATAAKIAIPARASCQCHGKNGALRLAHRRPPLQAVQARRRLRFQLQVQTRHRLYHHQTVVHHPARAALGQAAPVSAVCVQAHRHRHRRCTQSLFRRGAETRQLPRTKGLLKVGSRARRLNRNQHRSTARLAADK